MTLRSQWECIWHIGAAQRRPTIPIASSGISLSSHIVFAGKPGSQQKRWLPLLRQFQYLSIICDTRWPLSQGNMMLKSTPSFLSWGIFKGLGGLLASRISNNLITSWCCWLWTPLSFSAHVLELPQLTAWQSFSSLETSVFDFPLKGHSSLSSVLHSLQGSLPSWNNTFSFVTYEKKITYYSLWNTLGVKWSFCFP